MLPCQKQQLSIDLDFTRQHLRGTTIFQLDFTGFKTPGVSVKIQLPPNAAAWRVAARGFWPSENQHSPWIQIPSDTKAAGGKLQVHQVADVVVLDAEVIDALHQMVVKDKPDHDGMSVNLFIELAVEWQMSGEWLQIQSSPHHFIELPVHPRDAGGLSDGIGGHQCFETSVDMDFFLAGYLPRSPCWFPILKDESELQRTRFEIDVSVPLGFSVCTAGQLVQRQSGPGRPSQWRFVESCPLTPCDVPLIVGPLDEAEEKGTRVMAPCGFPLDEELMELQREKLSLVKTLDYPWPLLGCTALFLPLPHLRPPSLPKTIRSEKVNDNTRIHASSLPCYSIHGSVYIFDLSLLGSVCPSLRTVVRPVRSYALASAWFGVLLHAAPKDAWILHGLRRFLADSSLLQSWPSGVAHAEVSARLYEESQLWHALVEGGQDLQILCDEANISSTGPAEILGAVREVKSYLVCHQLSRILGWKAFHQQLIVVLQAFSNRSMSTSEFLEKMNEMEAVEADGRDLKAELSDFSKQWIYGLGCPEVHVGWFYNRSLHRLEFVASQTPLEPLALGDASQSPAISVPRITKKGIGFGYSGFGEVTSELLGAEARLAARAAVDGDGDAQVEEVPRKYWRGNVVINIHVTDGTPAQVELELRGTEPVYATWLFPSDVQRGNEEELPQGLAFLHLSSNQWPLAKLELAQPPEFWQGVLEKCADPSAEAESAKVLGDLAVAGKLSNIMLHRLPQALSLPLKEPGWHEITCASCALALCNWAAQLKKGDGLRSSLMRPVHHFLLESEWKSDTGLARARMLVARCLSVAPKSLELWQNFLPKCRSLQLHQSREDPLTLAALELLGHSPRSGSAQVMEALLLRLRLEEVLPSEHQRLAATALGTLGLLRLRLQAQDDPSPDSFLEAVPAGGTPSSVHKAWAKTHAMGSAPSSLEDKSKSQRGLKVSEKGYKWNRAVRCEACAGSYRGRLDGRAFAALSAALNGEDLAGQSGEILQEAVWTAEAVIRLPGGGFRAAKKKWDELGLRLMTQDSPQTWPALTAVLQSLRTWKSGESKRTACKSQVMAEAGEMVLWKTPGLYAKTPCEPQPLRSALAAALSHHQAKKEKVLKLKLRKTLPKVP
ncbi:unnamed protein product [Cladocopium goreaui]|uniref:Transcription initiation factor TFIID subunit 2 n=1 Tax=Cladocopium goreaui TaxID=2562237 RepID=A0A9P1BK10_9DINO|nr:unnamed protein product [Cladocopium goreaui]